MGKSVSRPTTFKEHDETRLYEDYAHYTDVQKLAARAMQRSEELAQILAQDWEAALAEKTKRQDEKRKADGKSAPAVSTKPSAAALKDALRKTA